MKEHKETEHYYWVETPIYAEYKTVEVDEYCDECGHVTGSHTEQRPVGKPIRSEWKRHKKDSWYYMNKAMEKVLIPKMIDNITKRSSLLDRLK